MKILIIGGGGREHALAHTFHRQGHIVYCLPGNPGTDSLCAQFPEKWKTIDPTDFAVLSTFAKEENVDLTICGPELPLERGIADIFNNEQLAFFGPGRLGSRIEYSKAWSKEFMNKNGIPTARYVTCKHSHEAYKAIDKYYHQWGGIVIKPSGLTGGKGVKVCNSLQEAQKAVELIMEDKIYGNSGNEVVLEELLKGKEVSIMALCDGKTTLSLLPCQDHKRLYDHGQGPNTGGIGAYAPVPFLTNSHLEEIEAEIVNKTLSGLIQESIDYRGCIYFGLMLTSQGPKLLEYNCRLGDPEAQALLPIMESDLAELLLECAQGALQTTEIQWKQGYSCCIVMVARGYPKSCAIGHEIHGLDQFESRSDLVLFHAKTKVSGEKIITNGGRVLGITALADTLEEASANAYKAVREVNFQGAYYRSDIAKDAIETNVLSLI